MPGSVLGGKALVLQKLHKYEEAGNVLVEFSRICRALGRPDWATTLISGYLRASAGYVSSSDIADLLDEFTAACQIMREKEAPSNKTLEAPTVWQTRYPKKPLPCFNQALELSSQRHWSQALVLADQLLAKYSSDLDVRSLCKCRLCAPCHCGD